MWAIITYSNSNTEGSPYSVWYDGFWSEAEAREAIRTEGPVSDSTPIVYEFSTAKQLSDYVTSLNAPYVSGVNAQTQERGYSNPEDPLGSLYIPSEPIPSPILIPELWQVGSVNNPYVFVVSGSPAFMEFLKNNAGSFIGKIDRQLDKLGYYVQFTGWDNSASEYQIAFVKKGTEPISLTLLLLIGIIAVTIAFVAYQVRFAIRAYMDGKILVEREDTAQAWIDGQRAVMESPFASEEDKQKAAENLASGDLPTTPSENPIPENPNNNGDGFFEGAGSGALLALAAVYLLSRKND